MNTTDDSIIEVEVTDELLFKASKKARDLNSTKTTYDEKLRGMLAEVCIQNYFSFLKEADGFAYDFSYPLEKNSEISFEVKSCSFQEYSKEKPHSNYKCLVAPNQSIYEENNKDKRPDFYIFVMIDNIYMKKAWIMGYISYNNFNKVIEDFKGLGYGCWAYFLTMPSLLEQALDKLKESSLKSKKIGNFDEQKKI